MLEALLWWGSFFVFLFIVTGLENSTNPALARLKDFLYLNRYDADTHIGR